MYNCRWFMLCETVIHDSVTNNMSIVNTILELRSNKFPSLYPKFAFATALERTDGSPEQLMIRVVREKEEEEEVLLTMEADNAPPRFQTFLNFPAGIRLYGTETAVFRLEVREDQKDWYTVSTQSIEIHKIEEDPATEGAPPTKKPE